ncbi:hypothetical protein RSPO_c02335 [Ralstonia solanacearum Po82]|uniref:Uncharacterized protein n=1 Tax=Ralstonia solanacearum (strain Po82) TaxID=1031711 RepID=F6G2E9_RALS8|nr:hypothetical protein RSPO_c02335 [Ralstonia solanacearum Po82]
MAAQHQSEGPEAFHESVLLSAGIPVRRGPTCQMGKDASVNAQAGSLPPLRLA